MALSDDQVAELERVREMLEVRMREKPRRYQHSLGVARTAVELARAYGVDEYLAALAGLTHDWDKVLDDHELLVRAAQYGVMVSGSPTLAVGLLHGPGQPMSSRTSSRPPPRSARPWRAIRSAPAT